MDKEKRSPLHELLIKNRQIKKQELTNHSVLSYKFDALLKSYCEYLVLGETNYIKNGEEFETQGINFRIYYDANTQPDFVFVVCDFGFIPEKDDAACYRELLEVNANTQNDLSTAMALCTDTGMALGNTRLAFEGLTPATLHTAIQKLLQIAKKWQHHIQNRQSKQASLSESLYPNRDVQQDLEAKLQLDFLEMITEYCRYTGLDAVEKILFGAPLKVNGTLFVISAICPSTPHFAKLYCDCGKLPSHAVHEIYPTLLLLNMRLHPTTGQVAMISEETDHIMLGQAFDCRTTSPNELQKMMVNMAESVKHLAFI